MPGYIPPTRLEGDYSTWTIYDSFDDAYVDNYLYYQYAIANKDETILTLILRASIGTRKYTIATKALGAVDEGYMHGGVLASPDSDPATALSILGTYVCALIRVAGQPTCNGIVIWKNGDLIKTFTPAQLGLDANEVYSVSISRSGKYLIVSGTRTASGNYGWVVLVGS